MIMLSTVCLGQDKVCVDRDSLFNVLLNVSELKNENKYLTKKTNNQKLVIVSQGIIIKESKAKTEILTEHISTEEKNKKKEWWKTFKQGALAGALIVLALLGIK